MSASGVITLLTDFGEQDPFVGVMKGVILARNPAARLVDLTHQIEPQCVAAGAFWLGEAFGYFPPGTTHVAVVDPGVGSQRAALVVEALGHLFVGPDNGIFERVTARAGSVRSFHVDFARAGLHDVSRTFHGRDVFAPVAAELSRGVAPDALAVPGPVTATALVPVPRWSGEELLGEVIVVDRFGNLVTNLTPSDWPAATRPAVWCGAQKLQLFGTFAELPPDGAGAIVGSFGYVELCARNASAKQRLGAQRGSPVRVSFERVST
jgi:S-adenosylmethionine hydrolase